MIVIIYFYGCNYYYYYYYYYYYLFTYLFIYVRLCYGYSTLSRFNLDLLSFFLGWSYDVNAADGNF